VPFGDGRWTLRTGSLNRHAGYNIRTDLRRSHHEESCDSTEGVAVSSAVQPRLTHPSQQPYANSGGHVGRISGALAAVCAGVLGTLIYRAETHNYRDQLQTRHVVAATAVDDSRQAASPDATAFTVDARWDANGITHTGAIGWDDAVKAGDRLQIWVDADGTPVSRPTLPELAGPEAVLVAVAAWFIMVLAAVPVLALVRANASGKREDQWDNDIRSLVEDSGGRTDTPQC
jgi:hypothetical protein